MGEVQVEGSKSKVQSRDSPWLSAGKVIAIEKIALTGKFCRAGRLELDRGWQCCHDSRVRSPNITRSLDGSVPCVSAAFRKQPFPSRLVRRQVRRSLGRRGRAYTNATHEKLELPASDNLLDFLPPDGKALCRGEESRRLGGPERRRRAGGGALGRSTRSSCCVPIPRPNKLLLLAGNYNEHITEGGGAATERAETFPYVF